MCGFLPTEIPVPGTSPVYVYSADLDAVFREYGRAVDDCLSPQERDRAVRFRRQLDSDRFRTSRFLLRNVLGAFTGLPAKEFTFRLNSHGKPSLESGCPRFNLTHSEQYFALGLSNDARIGIDIESRMTMETAVEVAPRILSDPEFAFWKGCLESMQVRTFTRFWTIKEAILKAHGTGLSEDPRNLELDLSGSCAHLRSLPAPFGDIRDWRLLELPREALIPDIAIALAF